MVPSACLVPSLPSFPFAAAYIVQSMASGGEIPRLTLSSAKGEPPRAKSKKGPITKLASTHPRKRGLGSFLIIRFSCRVPRRFRQAPVFRSRDLNEFLAPCGDSLLAETLNACPARFQEASLSKVRYSTANVHAIR